jgi:hypothetical protein
LTRTTTDVVIVALPWTTVTGTVMRQANPAVGTTVTVEPEMVTDDAPVAVAGTVSTDSAGTPWTAGVAVCPCRPSRCHRSG